MLQKGEFLMHYGRSKLDGAPIGSGRYPLGSGEEPYQRDGKVGSFNTYMNDLMKQGFTMKDIAKLNHMDMKELRLQYYQDRSDMISDKTGVKPYNPSSDGSFNKYVAKLKNENKLKEKEIAQLNMMEIETMRAKVSIASNQERALNVAKACQLRDHGYGPTEIGRKMGVNESTVRGWLKPKEDSKEGSLQFVADTLKKKIDDTGCYLEVGEGSELYLKGVSKTKMKTAVAMLKEQGYEKIVIQADQGITGKRQKTYLTLIAPPGTTYKDVVNNTKNIQIIDERFKKNALLHETEKLHYPEIVNSKRVMIRYAEDGGADRDGLIELRKGVKDLDLGPNSYAQVRINVDNTHYLKGMAMYCADDRVMPKGVDIIFNTGKKKGTPAMMDDPNAKQVFKNMKDPTDPVNPFGSYIRSQRGALNMCKEEGKWDDQRDLLAQQFLSKQYKETAKKQLDLAYAIKRDELDKLEAYTNPAVKKKLLMSFADECESAAVDLHAAALPRQSWKVILPIPQLKENEVYAPTYRQGEEVVLVRYPHGGIFELPVCKVNNNNYAGRKVIGQAKDAIGINPKTAAQLSGADFDGDSVVVIPTKGVKIKTSSPLAALKDFDPKAEYPYTAGMKVMSKKNTGREMGKVTNLITDMTVLGAGPDEIARAVKHSMVIIDAEKHKLNYKASEEANGIPELKKKYQVGGGAQTIFSRAKNEKDVVGIRTELKYQPDPKTGERRFKTKYEQYVDKKTGKVVDKITKSNRMTEAFVEGKSARSLISFRKDEMEYIYADYADSVHKLANEARKVMINTKDTIYDKGAEKTYAKEVRDLNAKLVIAKMNKPRERTALAYADQIVKEKVKANPDLKNDKDRLKKIRQTAIDNARYEMGAKKQKINIEPKEWEAIQAGAFSNSKLMQILNNCDEDQLKQYAMPKVSRGLSTNQINRIKAYANSNYTISEIADAMGVSTSTVSKYLSE